MAPLLREAPRTRPPRPRPTGNRARRARRSRCCSPISSASSSWIDCDCAGPAERAMSVCSQPSRKTYDESQSDCCSQHLKRFRYPHKAASVTNPRPSDP